MQCVIFWAFLSCVLTQPLCQEEEYPVGEECCPRCNPDMGMVTRRECSRWEDTLCRCTQGYFCKTQDWDHCIMCLPHSGCSPGQRVQKRGTDMQDTVCADCPTGTFSPGGTQEECVPWTKCKTWVEEERDRGTSSTDATCSFTWGFYFLLVTVPVLVLGTVLIVYRRRRRHTGPVTKVVVSVQGRRQEHTVRFPDTEVTIVAEEETALNR